MNPAEEHAQPSQLDDSSQETPTTRALRFAAVLGLGVPSSLNDDPHISIGLVCDILDRVATGDAPLADLVTAARSFLVAVSVGELFRVDAGLWRRLELAVDPAEIRVMGALPHDVVADEVDAGLAALRHFAQFFIDPAPFQAAPDFAVIFNHQLDMVALAADVLDASIRRQRASPAMLEGQRLPRIWRAERRAAAPFTRDH